MFKLFEGKKALTQPYIENRIKNILSILENGKGFHWADCHHNNDIFDEARHSEKWRTYLYLKKCVLDFRNRKPEEELTGLLEFLKDNKNKTWLSKKLLDKIEKNGDEYWGTSKHEWLERSLIVDVLKRSAGMVEGVECETEEYCIAGTYDWLYVQAELRSSNKYIFFKNEDNAIKSGHDGAVRANPKPGKIGTRTAGSYEFHQKLVEAFYDSTKIASFIKRVEKIFKEETFSGKKSISPDANRNYVVTGAQTDKEEEINTFRKKKLFPEYYVKTDDKIRGLFMWANQFEEDTDELSVSSCESDSSDEETPSRYPEDNEDNIDLLESLTLK